MRALFLGRFNPFHLGHIAALNSLWEEKDIDEVIIAIGSCDKSYSREHPFSAGERLLMIKRSLLEKDFSLEKVHVITIPDSNNNSLWVAQVENYAPAFDIVYSNNALIKILFSARGYTVKPIMMAKREEYNGTYIRKRIIQNLDVQNLIPRAVYDFMKEIDGFTRIRELSKTLSGEHYGSSAIKHE
ncbi:MAG: nicotinamide-nucleotide adenylyltransferase [Candidatus Hodarchaeales archaeon]|jgi:nicotinamide-nucleotide adenylyltransferase